MSSSSTLRLAGTLSMTVAEPSYTHENMSLTFGLGTAERTSLSVSDIASYVNFTQPTNYIKLTGDLNPFITHTATGADGVDDGWGITTFNVSCADTHAETIALTNSVDSSVVTSDWNVEYIFGTLYNTNLNMGKVTIVADTGLDATITNGTFYYNLAISTDASGLMSFTAGAYTGSDAEVTISATEEATLYQQQAYKKYIWSALNTTSEVANPIAGEDGAATTADNFTLTYTAVGDLGAASTSMTTQLATELSNVEGKVLVKSFSATIATLATSNTNIFSKWVNSRSHTNYSDYDTEKTSNPLFIAGDQLWVYDTALDNQLAYPLTLTMPNFNGTPQTMFTTTVGVVFEQQAASGAGSGAAAVPQYIINTQGENGATRPSANYTSAFDSNVVNVSYDAPSQDWTLTYNSITYTLTADYTFTNGSSQLVFDGTSTNGLIFDGASTNVAGPEFGEAYTYTE